MNENDNIENQPNNEPIGQLFGSVFYYSTEHLDDLIDSIQEEQALLMMKLACEKALFSGVYSLEETEILLKSLRKTHKVKI
jgi:hypothetical protein